MGDAQGIMIEEKTGMHLGASDERTKSRLQNYRRAGLQG
jgi:hypothetical protein